MLLKTYERILELFYNNHGYLNFEQLKDHGITVTQIQELMDKGSLEKFTRGWYWCSQCGLKKPAYHRYIEIAKANKDAVICMESAGYLLGILEKEPEVISVATERTDRRKMEFSFPVKRYYLQNTGLSDEIEFIETEYGGFQFYSVHRTACDCIRMKDKMEEKTLEEIRRKYKESCSNSERLMIYGRKLRALKCIKEQAGHWYDIEK